ncbi:ferritin heavy chain-like [Echinops telfairi]|uniref:Ferritin heavy chain-like n=1 Tax=Echinops telfairi TaxID=9371 RepID=A0AC55D3W2_ECHTE|nr:ferritin heavy chain-like [Echinops telfairi]
MASASLPEACQDYQKQCEAAINQQISLELHTSYTYLSMACHFNREDVALKNFGAYFMRLSNEGLDYVEALMQLQNQRKGRLQLGDIAKPDVDDWCSPIFAMEYTFHLQQNTNQSLVDLHRAATEQDDKQLCDFLVIRLLQQQAKTIKELGNHLIQLRLLRDQDFCLAEYHFNKLNLDDSDTESCPMDTE